jgi:hypothetical protein
MQRKHHSADFKAKVAIEAIKTINELSSEFDNLMAYSHEILLTEEV